MVLFQKFSLLLLMLLGGTFSALASEVDPKPEETFDISFSSELPDHPEDLFKIGLSAEAYAPVEIRHLLIASNFYYSSAHEAGLASIYICNSQEIDPGLDEQDIIFPFHFFF